MLRIILAVFAAVSLSAALPAQAEVITGPAHTYASGWNVTGVGFTANRNSALTGFTFQNTGKADTIVLTDNAGTILYSVATAAGTTSLPVSINWGLSSGATYWLLQTTDSNNLFAFYAPATLPSNADITMVRTGAFNSTIVDAVTNSNFAPTDFWASFNDITTSNVVAPVPEPATWALLIVGFGMLGAGLRRRRPTLARGAAA